MPAVHSYRYLGLQIEALTEAFKRLEDPQDWKAPIRAWVRGDQVMVSVAAIRFFTATTATVTLNTDTMEYLIESIGYRQGPAGDH